MPDNSENYLTKCLTPEGLKGLEGDIKQLLALGYGSITIQIQRHQIVGHEIKITKRYNKFKQTAPIEKRGLNSGKG